MDIYLANSLFPVSYTHLDVYKRQMQHALAKIQRTLMQPEVKQFGKEQVKKKAKESIMDMLAKAKINADRDNRERWEREGRIAPTKKQDMEL